MQTIKMVELNKSNSFSGEFHSAWPYAYFLQGLINDCYLFEIMCDYIYTCIYWNLLLKLVFFTSLLL